MNIRALHKCLSYAWEGREGAILFSAVLLEEQVVSHQQVIKTVVGPDHHLKILGE